MGTLVQSTARFLPVQEISLVSSIVMLLLSSSITKANVENCLLLFRYYPSFFNYIYNFIAPQTNCNVCYVGNYYHHSHLRSHCPGGLWHVPKAYIQQLDDDPMQWDRDTNKYLCFLH